MNEFLNSVVEIIKAYIIAEIVCTLLLFIFVGIAIFIIYREEKK